MAAEFLEGLRNTTFIFNAPMQTLLVEGYMRSMERHLSEWILDHQKKYLDTIRRSYIARCDWGHTETRPAQNSE